jgi:uncharacterized protein YbjT (DUF2867 family)
MAGPQRVALLGATGRTGRLVIERALARGLAVKVLARSPEKLGPLAAQLEHVAGDARDADSVARLVSGVDAVVSTLGTATLRQGGLLEVAVPLVVAAMRATGVRRYVALSSSAAVLPGERPAGLLRLVLGAGRLFAPRYVADKAAEVAAVVGADLEWTLVRPGGRLRDGADGELRVDLERPSTGATSRAAVATLIVRALVEGLWIRQAPFVSDA